MGVFDKLLARLRAKKASADAPTDPPPDRTPEERRAEKAPVDARLERLARLGQEGGPDATGAVELFRELRMTRHEGAALGVLADIAERLPDELATMAAKASVDRGENATARRFLSRASTPASLLLAADLAEDEGDPSVALALVERVLARAIDHPGARERHSRLAILLGRKPPAPVPAANDGTVLSAQVRTPYVIRREIARGGAAAVYEADDRELLRRVALKVYHDVSGGRDQLLHEARVATELTRPGVIRVYDVDLRGGWLVLEHFERGSLREWMRERPEEAARFDWLASLARTLDEVHAHGYVHLDVKPGNVLLRAANDAVLADFGCAQRAGAPSAPGSLGYVSPERIAGQHATVLDDVYGFGRIVQDVLASAPPESESLAHALAELARRCTGPAAERPNSLQAALDAARRGS